ncbi:hypothetical protein TIFTF001_037945 [Ficus carica]|uniref:Uncharacterized protein n=1 Tax=Ficus carica TaxID=3494 RepID=A0AA88EHR5_FICCA|nr:hypothetical protein TIFTF001_037945 [Ficus carica]
MAPKEKQVIESEFKLINISKAAIIDHVPCNTSEVQLFNLGFAHGQRSNTNMRSSSTSTTTTPISLPNNGYAPRSGLDLLTKEAHGILDRKGLGRVQEFPLKEKRVIVKDFTRVFDLVDVAPGNNNDITNMPVV